MESIGWRSRRLLHNFFRLVDLEGYLAMSIPEWNPHTLPQLPLYAMNRR